MFSLSKLKNMYIYANRSKFHNLCRQLSTTEIRVKKNKDANYKSVAKDKKEKKEKTKKEKVSSSSKYKQTVFLPQTSFPLHSPGGKNSNRLHEDLKIQKESDWWSVYKWQQSDPERRKEFVLHDGPPYANGRLHMGHALNKILKDITVRQKMLEGYKVHYVPGWDCHGLPIELKAMQQHSDDITTEPLKIRERARAFANQCVSDQKKGFQRWGVLGAWDDAYLTSHPEYVVKQLKLFADLHEKGHVFQALLPVYFSPSSATTLAEAELEYKTDHVSQAVHLALAVLPNSVPPSLKDRLVSMKVDQLHLPIWTTTPWSLPGNKCVCINPALTYSLVQVVQKGTTYALVWATDLLKELNTLGFDKWTDCGQIDVASLLLLKYYHPLQRQPSGGGEGVQCPVLAASYVTAEQGTGLVHTAPAHGYDDYDIAKQHGIDLKSVVDGTGRYITTAGPALAGVAALDGGNEAVITLLQQRSNEGILGSATMLLQRPFTHSYPYDWRTKQPIMINTSKQWFIDTQGLRDQALACLPQLGLHPSQEQGEKNLSHLLQRRHWCISRQRVWGVPLPVFYHAHTGEPIVDRSIIEHVCSVVRAEGTDAWWRCSEAELLPAAVVAQCKERGEDLPRKGKDILDIWLDSGCSWQVLPGDGVADLVIEGQDQYRGWFQASLLISLAARGKPPYKNILVHGFTVDEHGRKMSKSLGNVVDPDDITDGVGAGGGSGVKHVGGGSVKSNSSGSNTGIESGGGADLLRWWACSSTLHETPPCGSGIIFNHSTELQLLRRTIRYLLGTLHDYDRSNSAAPEYDSLPPLEKYMLHRLHLYDTKVWTSYRQYSYHGVTRATVTFLSTELSQIYIAACKHRLYCGSGGVTERRAVQAVLHATLSRVLLAVSPIATHMAEEVALHCLAVPSPQRQIHTPPPTEWHNPSVAALLEPALALRQYFHACKDPGTTIDTQRLEVIVKAAPHQYDALLELQLEQSSGSSVLCDLLQVARVTLNSCDVGLSTDIDSDDDGKQQFSLSWRQTDNTQCLRCRRYSALAAEELCEPCKGVVDRWNQNNTEAQE